MSLPKFCFVLFCFILFCFCFLGGKKTCHPTPFYQWHREGSRAARVTHSGQHKPRELGSNTALLLPICITLAATALLSASVSSAERGIWAGERERKSSACSRHLESPRHVKIKKKIKIYLKNHHDSFFGGPESTFLPIVSSLPNPKLPQLPFLLGGQGLPFSEPVCPGRRWGCIW